MFPKVDFAALHLWKAPELPPLEACGAAIQSFSAAFYEAHAPQIKRVLADLN
jgi:hypothetical protein